MASWLTSNNVNVIAFPSIRNHPSVPPRLSFPTVSGFTLIELMIVVAIIGILAAIAVPNFQAYRLKARYASFTADVKMMTDAFQTYNITTGSYPPDVNRGTTPTGMAEFLGELMTRPTPFGGKWDWEQGVFGIVAGISVVEPNAAVQQMQGLDNYLDNGDLTTGVFRQNGNRYIYIIEP